MTRKTKSKSNKKGRALRRGDCVALISPAGKIDRKLVEQSANEIRRLGFFVVEYPKRKSTDSFFSASDQDRAKELSWAFSEPAIRAVFSCRGGYGSARCLRLITKKQMAQWQPKLFVGYSDITYIHHWLFNQMGWKTLHGPLVGHLDRSQLRNFLGRLMEGFEARTETWNEVKILQSGKAAGQLFGGNLSLLQTKGLAQLPEKKMILFLEDVNENFYRIDRSIQNLIDAGFSKFISGVIVGRLHQCGKADSRSFGLKRLQESICALTDGPVWWGARFGHGVKDQRILQMGARVSLSGKKLRYE